MSRIAGLVALCLVLATVAGAQSPRADGERSVTLVGTLSRPVGPNQVQELNGFDVYLVDLDERRRTRVSTGTRGDFRLRGLRVGGLYYVVAVSHLRFEDATPRLRGFPGGGNTVIWMPDTSVRVVDWAVSWHQAVMVDKPGTYRLELSPLTMDPEFCGDLDPTFDSVPSTPYRSWRRAILQPVPPAHAPKSPGA